MKASRTVKKPDTLVHTVQRTTTSSTLHDCKEEILTPTDHEPRPSKFSVSHRAGFQHKSLSELIRAYTLLTIGGVAPFVENAKEILAWSRKITGDRVVNSVLGATLAAQYTGGINLDALSPLVSNLNQKGIGAILDYCAEADVDVEQCERDTELPAGPDAEDERIQFIVNPNFMDRRKGFGQSARTYFFENDSGCDRNEEICRIAITTASAQTRAPFAAIKITALLDPEEMVPVSRVIQSLRSIYPTECQLKMHHSCIDMNAILCGEADLSDKGPISRDDFLQHFKALFPNLSQKHLKRLSDIGATNSRYVDYVDWVDFVDEIWSESELVSNLGIEPVSQKGVSVVQSGLHRALSLATTASENDVRMMVDAEQTYFQPTIDMIVRTLKKQCNTKDKAPVWNTYQCYLKNTYLRVHLDQEICRRKRVKFGCKFVRGAYITQERKRAESMGYYDPVCPSLDTTHMNFDMCVSKTIPLVAASTAEFMIASHNQTSVENAVNKFGEYGLDPSSDIYFGQLLGMGDHITNSLAEGGYNCYKYVPYGPVEESVAYLIRRLEENSTLLASGPVVHERKMLWKEIKKRMSHSVGL